MARLGEKAYRGAFALLSIASLSFLIYAYRHAPCEPLWTTPRPLFWPPVLIVPIAFVFVVGAFTVPNPTAVGGEKALGRELPARGMLRVTRHPFLWGVMLWSGSHLVVNGNVPALFLFGSLIVIAGFLTPGGAASFGWFAYAPLSDAVRSPGVGGDMWVMGLAMSGFGTIMGAVNFITTILCMRAPGMTMFRMPIFTWNVLLTSILVLLAFPVLAAAYNAHDRRGLARLTATHGLTIGLLTAAAAVGLIVVGPTAIDVLLGGGRFDADDVARTAAALSVFALAVPFESLGHLLSRAIYATHHTIGQVVATLVGVLAVNGRRADAEAVAEEARMEWDEPAFHRAIDDALAGHVPDPWP